MPWAHRLLLQFDRCRRDVRDGSERGHRPDKTAETRPETTADVQRHAPKGRRPAGPDVRVAGRELLGRQQGPVPGPADAGHGDRGGHHIPGGPGRHGLRVGHAVLDDVHHADRHPVGRRAAGLRGPLPGAQAVPQRRPAVLAGLHAGHRVRRRCRAVRAVRHNGRRRRCGHAAGRQPGAQGRHHADRRQRAPARPRGRSELSDCRGLQKKLLVQTSTVHQARSSGTHVFPHCFVSYCVLRFSNAFGWC